MAVRVNVNKYIGSHGKRPGHAWGQWMFHIAGCDYTFLGTYTQAKSKATKKARELRATEITVMP
jgi:hypothetical protein